MIAPRSINEEIPWRKTFKTKADSLNKRNGRIIFRLDIRLDAMKFDVGKRNRENSAETFSHKPAARFTSHSVIPKIGILKSSTNDLVEIDDADNGIITPLANNKTKMSRSGKPFHPGVEALLVRKGLNPWKMQRLAAQICADKLLCVGLRDRSNRDTRNIFTDHGHCLLS